MSTSARWARSASSGLTKKSTSCSVFGPPRAQTARPPPSANGTSASRSAPAAFFIVRERSWTKVSVNGAVLGIAGTKGFVGGFPGSTLPDFGEPLLREVYAETGKDVAALEHGLAEIEDCRLRVVLLHYSPTMSTLA